MARMLSKAREAAASPAPASPSGGGASSRSLNA